ncbi:MAG: hypothetical protein M3296_07155 [Actinomycetota bacterium]|nr:hypothetical protein [Actinomycetota bacterium]
MLRTSQAVKGSMPLALALVLAAAAPAAAASTKPAASTGGVTNLTAQSVTLVGTLNPHGARTTYLFEYGPTTLYGAATPIQVAGSGTHSVPVLGNLAGLAPATRYHYRLVAHNRNGTTAGADRVFRTRVQPLGATLGAIPNPVLFGRGIVLGGVLSGTGNAGRPIQLQANPFPYTQGFVAAANPQVTNAQGVFAFPVLSVPVNTQYRVLLPDRPQVASPIVTVGVSVRVGTRVSARRVRHGGHVRFSGTLRPASDGAQIGIQKRREKRWITVAGTVAHHARGGVSRYGVRVRIRRGGLYRVFARILDGRYVASTGRTVRLRVR